MSSQFFATLENFKCILNPFLGSFEKVNFQQQNRWPGLSLHFSTMLPAGHITLNEVYMPLFFLNKSVKDNALSKKRAPKFKVKYLHLTMELFDKMPEHLAIIVPEDATLSTLWDEDRFLILTGLGVDDSIWFYWFSSTDKSVEEDGEVDELLMFCAWKDDIIHITLHEDSYHFR